MRTVLDSNLGQSIFIFNYCFWIQSPQTKQTETYGSKTLLQSREHISYKSPFGSAGNKHYFVTILGFIN